MISRQFTQQSLESISEGQPYSKNLLDKAVTKIKSLFQGREIMHKDVIDSSYGRTTIPIEVLHVYLTYEYEKLVQKEGFSLYIYNQGIENTLTVWGFLLDLGLEEQADLLKKVYDKVMSGGLEELDRNFEAGLDSPHKSVIAYWKELDDIGHTSKSVSNGNSYIDIEPTVLEELHDFVQLNDEIFSSFVAD